jgi:hypothetical protein
MPLAELTELSRAPVCAPCKYAAASVDARGAVTLTSTIGYGRTGNVMRALHGAARRAHECKTALILPDEDAKGHVLLADAPTRQLNFSSRLGPAHPDCGDPGVGAGLSGDAGKFAEIWLKPLPTNTTPAHAQFSAAYDPEQREIDGCLRHYIGVCRTDYCAGQPDLRATLVLHLRQGDIFPPNYAHAHERYGQPPLSYFLSALSYPGWKEALVVGERTPTPGPTWRALSQLNRTGVTKLPIRFQASDWQEDFRTLMCAPNLAESYSSMHEVLLLGRVQRFFSWRCFEPHSVDTAVMQVPFEEGEAYPWFSNHSNSAEEWVGILLHDAAAPRPCALPA